MTVVPRAAIAGRSACTDDGLIRTGLLQSPGCDDAGERRMKTPMRGPLLSAHRPAGGGRPGEKRRGGPLLSAPRPDGGGQAEAKMASSLFDVAASDLPGFHAYGAEIRRAWPNAVVAAVAGVANESTATIATATAVVMPRMPRILAGVASDGARVPEPVDGGGLNPPAPSGACGFESHPGHGADVVADAATVSPCCAGRGPRRQRAAAGISKNLHPCLEPLGADPRASA